MRTVDRLLISIAFVFLIPLKAQYILIPMDFTQKDHLKAYGIAYWVLSRGTNIEWLAGVLFYSVSQLFRNRSVICGVFCSR